jgi:hypothetical protein
MSTITAKDGTEVSDMDFGQGISELNSRSENGIDVTLLRQQCDNTALAVVVDQCNGEAFLLDIDENDNALDMFRHAYAAHRRMDGGLRAHSPDLRIAA